MSEGLKRLSSELSKGLEYCVVYIGPPGGDISQIGDKVLRFRGRYATGMPQMPRAMSFGEDANPDARYVMPLSTAHGPFAIDARYSFTQIYEGPMASGYGPSTGGRRCRRHTKRRRTQKKTSRSRK